MVLLGGMASASVIRQCLDVHGRLIYTDQPCMGPLRRADIDAPMQEPAWRSSRSGCRMRSPLLQISVVPPPLPPPLPPGVPAAAQAMAPVLPPYTEPDSGQDDGDPGTLGLWLELAGSEDGVAIRIRGFQPLPAQAISFDSNIDGQGIRLEGGELIAVDSMDDPGTLRYGFRKSAILLRRLNNSAVATLDVRLPGWQAQPLRLDAAELKDAVQRVRDCVRQQEAVAPAPRS